MFKLRPSEDLPLRKELGLCGSNIASFEVVFLRFLLRPLLIEEAMLAEEVNRLCSVLGMPMLTASSGTKPCCDLLKLNLLGEFVPLERDDFDTDGFTK
jgi:hypothetical protein